MQSAKQMYKQAAKSYRYYGYNHGSKGGISINYSDAIDAERSLAKITGRSYPLFAGGVIANDYTPRQPRQVELLQHGSFSSIFGVRGSLADTIGAI